jgi:peptide deformylase
MAIQRIRLLGDPVLRTPCAAVKSFGAGETARLVDDLRDTLESFRSANGYGRGIAAPQIGVSRAVIVTNVVTPLALINPVIVKRSRKAMTLWDDCFSFPDLLVRVKRHLCVDVRYQDSAGKTHLIHAEGGLSELLQHEIDHLNGILALDRAIDSRHIVYRSEHEKWAGQETGMLL